MHKDLQTFARNYLKDKLALLSTSHHEKFKRMYSSANLRADINYVVDNMPAEKLDWAMQQVTNTFDLTSNRGLYKNIMHLKANKPTEDATMPITTGE